MLVLLLLLSQLEVEEEEELEELDEESTGTAPGFFPPQELLLLLPTAAIRASLRWTDNGPALAISSDTEAGTDGTDELGACEDAFLGGGAMLVILLMLKEHEACEEKLLEEVLS